MDIVKYNKSAWNSESEKGNEWTKPVDAEAITRARDGNWGIVLTPTKSVPKHWFPELKGAKVLCLASGGGQQGPTLSAIGADVTVLDNSPKQLDADRFVAEREGLNIKTVEGDMIDLSCFEDEFFDLIVHPISNCFIPSVLPLWKEAHRVLKKGGTLMAGFVNSFHYTLDQDLRDKGVMQMKYSLPYSDTESLTDDERKRYIDANEPLEFGHTLTDQIGGQIDAGFSICGFYEDGYGDKTNTKAESLDKYMEQFIVTKAIKN